MQNFENLDVFEILITQKLLKCLKDPFVRSWLIYTFVRACPDFTFMAVRYHPPENAAFPQCMFSLLKLNASSTEEVLNP